MITEFGKKMRYLRIDNDERLIDMAKRLKVSSAFLSAVERGNKKPPQDLVSKLSQAYKIIGTAFEELQQAANRSRNNFIIGTDTEHGRDTAALLARKFNTLTEEDMKKIRQLLTEGAK